MDKRMLLAIILSIAILITYQYFFVKPVPQPLPQEKAAHETIKEEAKATTISPKVVTPVQKAGISEKEIRVENDLYVAIFTSMGGTIKSIELKRYKDKNSNPIILKGDDALPPLAIGVDEQFQFSKVNFSVQGRDLKLGQGVKTGVLVFEYSSDGYSIRRTYTFKDDDYGIDLRDEVSGLSSYWITLGKDFGIYERDSSVHSGPVVLKDADRMEFVAKKLTEPKNFKEGIRWVAQEDKYFFSSIVPKAKIEDSKVWSKNGDALVAIKLSSGVNDYFIYAGPKEYDTLKKYGFGLEHIVDFGFFSILARPLFWILKLFYSISHNYGIAIIILTILVRIPFIPLINKGQKSMKKLQDIQPRMAEIREKYKNDPQKMQKELMDLYKKHKVNPMGGCLPMLLQIPVFFALYKVLLIAIELRGAPFMLWIKDLSAKDPYYILPVIMGATMVIQQKMTPSTMDPTQQKIMMIMPVVFTFMFLTFPSGLVLYWLVNNVLSIAQQWYMNRKLKAV
ncbi:membrane protein insertase YidC [Dissulfurispira thermophila]|uniref:Membrane protein insertase YidC n=2 Tax=root TaxID=1 RepID=A0A7G1H5J5_9BACT|nr:membrane protein insertase YidC [Dissulfurispira thermophila]BCB97196.1 membrane protein insertase YidC [Dissulfurispira thermophila]